MEGTYKVEENINFENFLRAMGVQDEESIQKMIQATKLVTLKQNADGTWTQETGLRTSTFPLNKEFEDSFGGKVATGLVTLEEGKMVKTYKIGDTTILTETLLLSDSTLTATLVTADGTQATRRMVKE
eukprot:GFUD01080627.1.p1 GENE.GFUD01080627.1~~GFUD01080627.1.p1  ORF type:complete len:128 (-),score=51.87 GFUD01080627.1:166-549(-)